MLPVLTFVALKKDSVKNLSRKLLQNRLMTEHNLAMFPPFAHEKAGAI